MRTKGFCLALLRCGEIKLLAEKREYAISDLIANIARTKRRRTKSFGTQSSFTLCLILSNYQYLLLNLIEDASLK